MAVVSLVTLLLFGAVSQAPRDPVKPASDISARLSAFEKQAASGKVDAEQLAGIARTVLEQATESTDRFVAIEACASGYAVDRTRCVEKLWATARQANGTLQQRMGAASALVALGERGSAEALLGLARGTPPAQLGPVAHHLQRLPKESALPLLVAMLESRNSTAEVAACRLLGDIQVGETQAALQRFLAGAPRGTSAWQACTLAAAKVGDLEAQRTASALVNYADGLDLVQVAEVIAPSDPERGTDILMLATRKSTGIPQLAAAEKLVPLRPDVARRIVESALGASGPEIRAAALEVHRTLQADPDTRVRGMLIDRDPMVRLRAAETVLAWAARQKPAAAKMAPGRL